MLARLVGPQWAPPLSSGRGSRQRDVRERVGEEGHELGPSCVATLVGQAGGMSKDLTNSANRNRLADESFALPDERSYPIPDITHARNALARVAQDGTEEEQKQVRQAVEKKYPSLKKE